MKNGILAMELNMYYCEEDDIFEEGISDKLYSVGARISAAIKKMIVEMRAFAREVVATIHSSELKMRLKIYVEKVKKELAAGNDVYIPDIEKITKVYNTHIAKLRKDVNTIGAEFSSTIGSGFRHLDKYNSNKDKLSDEIDKMISEVSTSIMSSKIKISPSMSNDIGNTIINTVSSYISSYVKLIDDLEKLAIRFERNTARAEIDHDVRVVTNDHLSRLAKIKQGSTKMVRKSVFAICAITGI